MPGLSGNRELQIHMDDFGVYQAVDRFAQNWHIIRRYMNYKKSIVLIIENIYPLKLPCQLDLFCNLYKLTPHFIRAYS